MLVPAAMQVRARSYSRASRQLFAVCFGYICSSPYEVGPAQGVDSLSDVDGVNVVSSWQLIGLRSLLGCRQESTLGLSVPLFQSGGHCQLPSHTTNLVLVSAI